MSEENKAIIRRFIDEVINERNAAAADKFLADDYVDHGLPPELPPGREGFKQFMQMIFTAFPDTHYENHDMIAEGEKIVSRGTWTGTHKGEFMGIAATGKKVEVQEVHIARMVGGKMAEHWESVDQLGMMRQLGVIPEQG